MARQWPGSVATTRAAALDDAYAVPDGILAFLDADETAPPTWLEALAAPIEAGDADVTGGPTRAPGPPGSRAEAYWNRHDARFYDTVVAHDAAALPMGNSAWRVSLLRRIGGFDARLAGGGEDYDVNLRARAAGARFVFVPDAWVWHDQSGLRSYGILARRMHRYAKGATIAYRKNAALTERSRAAARDKRIRHPADLLMLAAKATGFAAGLAEWRRLRKAA
jgi:GT2 family glycosyltransferase